MRRAKKGSEGQSAKPLTPSPAIDALIGDEEQNGKQKKGKGMETKKVKPLNLMRS